MCKTALHWDPARRTHRGRLRVEKRRDNRGDVVGLTLVLVLKPTKTDPTGYPHNRLFQFLLLFLLLLLLLLNTTFFFFFF